MGKEPQWAEQMAARLRTFDQARAYPPNQVFLGGYAPEVLWDTETPCWQHGDSAASRFGPYGEMIPGAELYGLLRLADEFDLMLSERSFQEAVPERLREHPPF